MYYLYILYGLYKAEKIRCHFILALLFHIVKYSFHIKSTSLHVARREKERGKSSVYPHVCIICTVCMFICLDKIKGSPVAETRIMGIYAWTNCLCRLFVFQFGIFQFPVFFHQTFVHCIVRSAEGRDRLYKILVFFCGDSFTWICGMACTKV